MALNIGGRGSSVLRFEGLKNETKDISEGYTRMGEMRFQDCESCQFTVTQKCGKIALQSCRNIVLRLQDDLGIILEVSSSDSIEIHGAKRVTTLQIDGCSDLTANFCADLEFPMVQWATLADHSCEQLLFNHGALSLRIGLTDVTAQLMPGADPYLPGEQFFVHRQIAPPPGPEGASVPLAQWPARLVCVTAASEKAYETYERRVNLKKMTYTMHGDFERAMRITDSFGRRDDFPGPPSEIIPGKLHIASFLEASDVALVKQLSVTHVINVAIMDGQLDDGAYGAGIGFTGLNLRDEPDVNVATHFDEIFRVMHSAIEGGGHVLIHCKQGKSRSATFVILYLMRTRRMTTEEAFNMVHGIRSIVIPNFGFLLQLINHERELRMAQASS